MSNENQTGEERDILEGILTKFFGAHVYKRATGLTSSVSYVRVCDEEFGFPPKPTLDFHVGPTHMGVRNGFLVEEVIACVVDHIQTLNKQVSSPNNVIAVHHLRAAITALEGRGNGKTFDYYGAAKKPTGIGGPGGLDAGNVVCTPINNESDGQK